VIFGICPYLTNVVDVAPLVRNAWEGVNILPFIRIKLLKETIAKYCPDSALMDDEVKRNVLGKIYFYRYDLTCTDTVVSPNVRIGL
jgi:5'-3' exonuclease